MLPLVVSRDRLFPCLSGLTSSPPAIEWRTIPLTTRDSSDAVLPAAGLRGCGAPLDCAVQASAGTPQSKDAAHPRRHGKSRRIVPNRYLEPAVPAVVLHGLVPISGYGRGRPAPDTCAVDRPYLDPDRRSLADSLSCMRWPRRATAEGISPFSGPDAPWPGSRKPRSRILQWQGSPETNLVQSLVANLLAPVSFFSGREREDPDSRYSVTGIPRHYGRRPRHWIWHARLGDAGKTQRPWGNIDAGSCRE